MKRLLQETCKKVSVRTEIWLSDKELANLQKRYRNILTRGEKITAGHSTRAQRKTWQIG